MKKSTSPFNKPSTRAKLKAPESTFSVSLSNYGNLTNVSFSPAPANNLSLTSNPTTDSISSPPPVTPTTTGTHSPIFELDSSGRHHQANNKPAEASSKSVIAYEEIDSISEYIKQGANTKRSENPDLTTFFFELQFLNRYFDPAKTSRILYLGTPGKYFQRLLQLFPEAVVTLVTDSNYESELINDIRRSNPRDFRSFDEPHYLIVNLVHPDLEEIKRGDADADVKQAKNEELKLLDMYAQLEIYQALKPVNALLKYRLPHYYANLSNINDNNFIFPYLDGVVLRPIYTFKSMEGRLIPNDESQVVDKNFKIYNLQMNYYHQTIRETLSFHPLDKNRNKIGKDRILTFDNVVAASILIDYFNVRGYPIDSEELDDILENLFKV